MQNQTNALDTKTFYSILFILVATFCQQVSASAQGDLTQPHILDLGNDKAFDEDALICPICLNSERQNNMKVICTNERTHAICKTPCLSEFSRSSHRDRCPLCRSESIFAGPEGEDERIARRGVVPFEITRDDESRNRHRIHERRSYTAMSLRLAQNCGADRWSRERLEASLLTGTLCGTLCLTGSCCFLKCMGISNPFLTYIPASLCCVSCTSLHHTLGPDPLPWSCCVPFH